MEIWKTIDGFPDYQISNEGRVQSKRSKSFWVGLKGGYDSDGYHIVLLYRNEGKRYTAKIHRLVAQAFIPNIDKKSAVNHINGNKKDNRVENLEWSTNRENTRHAIDTGLMRPSFDNERPVIQMDLNGKVVKTYSSAASAKKDGFHRQTIVHCCSGATLTHKGFIWCYADNDIDEHYQIIVERLLEKDVRKLSNIKPRAVERIDISTGEVLEIYDSLSKASKNGYQHSGISLCCRGLAETHKGFKWKYHSF